MRLRAAIDNSVFVTRLRQLSTRVEATAQTSRTVFTNSRLYRWFTAEPEPDVIVIDLRETVTIGPMLRLLDQFGAWVRPVIAHSRVGRSSRRLRQALRARPIQVTSGFVATAALLTLAVLVMRGTHSSVSVGLVALVTAGALFGMRVTLSWAALTKTRGYQLVASVFAPPKPSEQHPAETADGDDRESREP